MKPLPPLLIALSLSLASTAFAAGKLGDPAPKLSISDWVKGKAVSLKDGKGKQTYVVEFWATWCPPCRASIPHLTELQAKFKDKNVTFIGVSDEDVDKVKPFVEKLGDKMDYVVAVDDDNQTSKAYMGAYGIDGIPHAFVVDKEGRVVWHGHPMDKLDKVVEQVVAGTFDLEAAKKEAAQAEQEAQTLQKAGETLKEYFKLAASGDDNAKAKEIGKSLLADYGKNAQIMNAVSWNILDTRQLEFRDLDFAMATAKAALDATESKDAAVMDTYARALYETGKYEDAVTKQKEAIKLLTGDEDMKKQFERTLKRYEKRAQREKDKKAEEKN